MRSHPLRTLLPVVAVFSALAFGARAADSSYDPLAIPASFAPRTLDLTVRDESRKRDIPVRVYLPAATLAAPVVLFSHGLGGSRAGSAYLGDHWSGRGYVAVFLQHPGSDESVWRSEQPAERMAALEQAANLENFFLRVSDVRAVLDQLGRWNADADSELAGRLDLDHVGMSGHSFGAVTTEAVSGEHFPAGELTESRIKAAVVMSPSTPHRGTPEEAFGAVSLPWMLMTGTKDLAPIGQADMKSRLGVYPALPAGGKYEVVLDRAEHSAFTDRALPGDREPRNPNHHRVILALSTAFWDAYLRGDAAAKAWLDGDGPRSMLEPQDRWQRK